MITKLIRLTNILNPVFMQLQIELFFHYLKMIPVSHLFKQILQFDCFTLQLSPGQESVGCILLPPSQMTVIFGNICNILMATLEL